MFKGIFPPIPTPFVNEEIAFDKLRSNVNKWNETKISGYVVFGSNGESVYLTREEKLETVEVLKDACHPDKKIIAGTGSDSIKETIFLTNEIGKRGADAALLLTPSFYQGKMNHEAFISYFNQVADNTNIPVMIYNVPKFTNVIIDAATVAELSKHENIVGVKQSAENLGQFAEMVHKSNEDFSCIVGTASILFGGLMLGASGGILALANIAPNQCVRIVELVEEGKIEEARQLQFKLLDANKAVTAKYGIAGLKAALDALGYFGGDPRSPLPQINEKDKSDLLDILKKAEIL